MPELIGYSEDGTPQYSFSDEDKLKGISVRPHNALLDPAPVAPEQPALPVDVTGVGYVPSETTGFRVADRLFGLNGQERFQTWPERMVREAVSGPHKALTEGFVPGSDEEINAAQAMASMAGMGSIPMAEKMALGSAGGKLIQPSAAESKAPVFYSALENAVNNITANKMPADQWLGTLTNAKGVKPEEMEWTGLKDFLAEQKGPVTKDQVQQYLDANKVELKEVNKGDLKFNKDSKYALPEVIRAAKEAGETPGDLELTLANDGNAYRALTKKFPELSENENWAEVVAKDVFGGDSMPAGTSKFSKYQLPGGENYRETLLTLPDQKGPYGEKAVRQYQDLHAQLQQKYGNGLRNKATSEELKELDRLDQNSITKNPAFKSSHWDEPNVLAHVRMNDRTMNEPGYSVINSKSGNKSQVFATREEAEAYQSRLPKSLQTQIVEDKLPKKSLHLEEIQSDWHQLARDKGYALSADKIEKLRPQFDKIDEKLLNSNDEQLLGHPEVDGMLKMAVDKKIITPDEAKIYKQVSDTSQTGAVPDAPFKKTWHELVLKRMLREAAEKGYDRLSWTPGEAQAARSDLSKEVKSIHWQPSIADKNSTLIQIHPNSGDKLKLQVNKNGKVEASFPASQGSQFEGKTLAEVIGKEHADKILSKTDGSLEGEGLKIGGEGMKGFYDQIIPKALEKIGKEHGVKVKTGYITKPEMKLSYEELQRRRSGIKPDPAIFQQPIHYIDIPQSLKDQALRKGFPLFSSGVMLSPVEQSPFDNQPKLTPVPGNPFE